MAEHDPKTSLAKIVKFNKQNPEEYEIVGHLIKGQAETLSRLHELRNSEPDKEKFGYYWTWVNKAAAMEADAKVEGLDVKPKTRKVKTDK